MNVSTIASSSQMFAKRANSLPPAERQSPPTLARETSDSVELSDSAPMPRPGSPLLDPGFQFLLGSSISVATLAAGYGRTEPLVIDSYWYAPGEERQDLKTHFSPLKSESVFSVPEGQKNYVESTVESADTLRVRSTFGDDVLVTSLQPEQGLKTHGVHVKGTLAGLEADFDITLRGDLNRGNEHLKGFDVQGTLDGKDYSVKNDFEPRYGTTSVLLMRGKLHSTETLGGVEQKSSFSASQGGKRYGTSAIPYGTAGWVHNLNIPR